MHFKTLLPHSKSKYFLMFCVLFTPAEQKT